MTHRQFQAVKAEDAGEPITFDIDGDQFAVPRPLPGIALLELAALGKEDDPAQVAAAFMAFLRAALPAQELDRFRASCITKRVDQDLLLAIVQHVIEEGAARPTQPPSISDGRHSTTGPTSNGEPVTTGH